MLPPLLSPQNPIKLRQHYTCGRGIIDQCTWGSPLLRVDSACSQSMDVILTPTGKIAVTQWRLRSNLSGATERSICKVEEPFETHLKLKLPTSTLERVPLQSSLRLKDRLQSADDYEFRRILMERNSIIKTADLLRMSTSNIQQVERAV